MLESHVICLQAADYYKKRPNSFTVSLWITTDESKTTRNTMLSVETYIWSSCLEHWFYLALINEIHHHKTWWWLSCRTSWSSDWMYPKKSIRSHYRSYKLPVDGSRFLQRNESVEEKIIRRSKIYIMEPRQWETYYAVKMVPLKLLLF